jgi:hypothetical protein
MSKSTLKILPALIVAITAAVLPVTPARASLIGTIPTPPGATVFPGLVPPGTDPGTLLAALVLPESFTTTAGTTSFTLDTAVFREAGGTLDFYYQLANSAASASALARLSATSFLGFETSLGFRVDGSTLPGGLFVDGTVPPETGDRNLAGTVVGFNFNPPDSAKIIPGAISNVLVISTDATSFAPGNFSVIDGGTFTGAAFQPAAPPAVPDSGTSAALLGLGVASLLVGRRFVRLQV